MSNEATLRKTLLELLRGKGAHADFDAAIGGLPPKLRGARVLGLEHTAWQLLEHLRIAQWDILEFSRDAKHKSPDWPEGYWPKSAAPKRAAEWGRSVKTFRRDTKEMQKLVANPKTDLFAPIPHGDGQTILREALLVADHNAYHIGQLIQLRKLLGAWKEK